MPSVTYLLYSKQNPWALLEIQDGRQDGYQNVKEIKVKTFVRFMCKKFSPNKTDLRKPFML